tara:strand:+ start:190 stop:315 length:126 start_codon:yes stop_codon:yes gene_type:complete
VVASRLNIKDLQKKMEAEINSIPKEMEDVEKKGVTEVDNKE